MNNLLLARLTAVLAIVAISGCFSFSGRNGGSATSVAQTVEMESRYLRIVAEHLGMELPRGRANEDLMTDIKLAIDNAVVPVPPPFDVKIIDSLKLCLSEEDGRHLDKVNEMLKKLHNRDVYVFPGGAQGR